MTDKIDEVREQMERLIAQARVNAEIHALRFDPAYFGLHVVENEDGSISIYHKDGGEVCLIGAALTGETVPVPVYRDWDDFDEATWLRALYPDLCEPCISDGFEALPSLAVSRRRVHAGEPEHELMFEMAKEFAQSVGYTAWSEVTK